MGIEFFLSGPIASVLNGLIVVVVVVAFADVALAYISTTRDRQVVDAAEKTGPRGDPEGLLAFVRRKRSSGVVFERIEMLQALGKQHEAIDQEMLAAVASEAYRRSVPFARWAYSALVLIGLAGTLIGLSLALVGLGGVINPEALPSAQVMAGAILETLDGMKLAFSTTLAGVVGAVLVGAAVALLRNAQSKAILRLETVTTSKWLPLFQTTEESRMSDAVRELERTREVLKAGLETTIQSIREGFGDLEVEFEARSRKMIGQLGEVRDATLSIIGRRGPDSPSLADYVETVRTTTEALQESVHAAERLVPTMQDAIEQTIRREHVSLRETLATHTEAVVPILEKQELAARRLGEAVASELERLEDVHDVLDRLAASLEGARETWEQADRAIEKMGQETADALRKGLSGTLAQVERLTSEQSKAQNKITAMIERFEETNSTAIQMLQEQAGRSLKHSQEVVGEIRKTLSESLEQVGHQLAQVETRTSSRVAEGLSTLGRELRDVATIKPGDSSDGAKPPPLDPPEKPLDELDDDLEQLD